MGEGGRWEARRGRAEAPQPRPHCPVDLTHDTDSNINGCRWARRALGLVRPTVVAASAWWPRAGLASGVGVARAPCALGKASRATDRLGCTDRWARRVGCGPRCRLCQLEGAGEKDEGRARPIEVPLWLSPPRKEQFSFRLCGSSGGSVACWHGRVGTGTPF